MEPIKIKSNWGVAPSQWLTVEKFHVLRALHNMRHNVADNPTMHPSFHGAWYINHYLKTHTPLAKYMNENVFQNCYYILQICMEGTYYNLLNWFGPWRKPMFSLSENGIYVVSEVETLYNEDDIKTLYRYNMQDYLICNIFPHMRDKINESFPPKQND